MREPALSIGFTGCEKNGHIPGGPIWTLHWLPKGYAPTAQDRLLGVFFDTDGRWSGYGKELPPLLRAVKDTIEKHLREHPEDAAGHLESKDWSDGKAIDGTSVEITAALTWRPMT